MDGRCGRRLRRLPHLRTGGGRITRSVQCIDPCPFGMLVDCVRDCGFAISIVLRPTRPRRRSSHLSPLVLTAVVAFAVVLAFLFWLGTVAAPSNLDAMNYHLPRAAEWATNHNVNNYATTIDLQVYDGRLAEYFITQHLILDGTDRLLFIPQFLAYAMASILVAGLARLLGGGRRGALWGLLLAATMPVAIMEATTEQNDLVVASVVLAAYYLGAVLWRLDRAEPAVLILCGAAAGLAIETKAFAVLVLLPLGIALVVMAWRRRWVSPKRAGWVGVALAVCIILTLPMTLRNWDVYRNPSGPPTGLDVASMNPAGLMTAATQSTLLNVDSLYYNINVHIDNVERSVGNGLGWAHPNQSFSVSTSWPVPIATPTEDGSGDFVAYLALFVAGISLISRRVRSAAFKTGAGMTFMLLASGVGLAAILFLLKWQPWGARFQLMALYPLLACVAVILSGIRGRVATIALCTALIGLSAILVPSAALRDVGKPVIGNIPSNYLALPRTTQYFRWWCSNLLASYTDAVHEVFAHHQSSLGYVSQTRDFEYPLWALMSQQADGRPVHVIPLDVTNLTKRYDTRLTVRPYVALVTGPSVAGEETNAKPLLQMGYTKQSVVASGCETVGVYVLSNAESHSR